MQCSGLDCALSVTDQKVLLYGWLLASSCLLHGGMCWLFLKGAGWEGMQVSADGVLHAGSSDSTLYRSVDTQLSHRRLKLT